MCSIVILHVLSNNSALNCVINSLFIFFIFIAILYQIPSSELFHIVVDVMLPYSCFNVEHTSFKVYVLFDGTKILVVLPLYNKNK